MTYVIERGIIGDVQAPVWGGYVNDESHAMLLDEPRIVRDGKGKIIGYRGDSANAACGVVLTGAPVQLSTERQCKVCAKQFVAPPKTGKGLSERQLPFVDTGSQKGDPKTASKRRDDDVDGAFQRGTVKVKRRVVDPATGKAALKAVDVEGTLENLREALEYAQKGLKRLKKRESIAEREELIRSLHRRIYAAERGPMELRAERAGAAKGQREHGRSDGIALTHGRDMTGETPAAAGRNGTLKGKLGAEHADRGAVAGVDNVVKHDREKYPRCAAHKCDHIAGGRYGYHTYAELNAMSATQRKRYWREGLAKAKAKAQREARYVSGIEGRLRRQAHGGELASSVSVAGVSVVAESVGEGLAGAVSEMPLRDWPLRDKSSASVRRLGKRK